MIFFWGMLVLVSSPSNNLKMGVTVLAFFLASSHLVVQSIYFHCCGNSPPANVPGELSYQERGFPDIAVLCYDTFRQITLISVISVSAINTLLTGVLLYNLRKAAMSAGGSGSTAKSLRFLAMVV